MNELYYQLSRALEAGAHKAEAPVMDGAESAREMDANTAYLLSVAEDAGFEETDHPREGKGSKGGGRFTKKPETLAKEDERDMLSKGVENGGGHGSRGGAVSAGGGGSGEGGGNSKGESIEDVLEAAEKEGAKKVLAAVTKLKEERGRGSGKLLDAVLNRLNACNERYFWALRRGETGKQAKYKNIVNAYYQASENISQNRGIAVTKNTGNQGDARKGAREAVFRVSNS